jgi:Cellulose binding domain
VNRPSVLATCGVLFVIGVGCSALVDDGRYHLVGPEAGAEASVDVPTAGRGSEDAGARAQDTGATPPGMVSDADAGSLAVSGVEGGAPHSTTTVPADGSSFAEMDSGSTSSPPHDAANLPHSSPDASIEEGAAPTVDGAPQALADSASDGFASDATNDAHPCANCLQVLYRSDGSGNGTASCEVQFELGNVGLASIDLSTVTVRYYFTADACGSTGLGSRCDAALLESHLIACPTVTFVTMPVPRATADTYMEVRFPGDGVITPGSPPPYQFALAFLSAGYVCPFQQTNDYSFFAGTPTQFLLTHTMTAYVDGKLVWGVEP